MANRNDFSDLRDSAFDIAQRESERSGTLFKTLGGMLAFGLAAIAALAAWQASVNQ